MEGVALAAIGLTGTVMIFVVKPLFALLKANTKAQERQTKALQEIATATKRGNKESAQRNGHLGELIVEQGKQTERIAEKSVAAILEANKHVTKQSVDKQIVNEREVKEG